MAGKQPAPGPPGSGFEEEDVMKDLSFTGLNTIQDQMEQLQMSMADEYDRLKAEWKKYLKDKEEMDRIRGRITSVSVSELDRLKLNVGGRRFEIRATCATKNTYFRSLLSGTFTPADQDGFYFIDRDPEYVQVVMNFLRDGQIDLNDFNDRQLARIRQDAEFYMVQELQTEIDTFRTARKSGEGINLLSVNTQRPVTDCFNGVFIEINVTRPNFKLHSISFVAGERRKIVGEAFLKEGGIDSAGQLRRIGTVEQQVDKGQLVCINFSAVPLPTGTYVVGVYSVSCPTAIAVCPIRESQREQPGFVITRSYHTANQKGAFNQRAGDNEFDFSGELSVSY